MTPSHRTPQQRDRRFARIRRLTQMIFIGSGAVSAVLVGYAANAAKPVTTTTVPVTTTTQRATTTTAPHTGATTPTTVYRPPTTVPKTTTTVCTTTPSGTVTCY